MFDAVFQNLPYLLGGFLTNLQLAGLALAVMLGLKLYPDKKTKASSSEKSYGYQDEGKTA